MTRPTFQHHKIRTVEDFLKLHPERRAIALAEFAQWCRVMDTVAEETKRLGKLRISIIADTTVFNWVDDDKSEARFVVEALGE